MKDGRSKMLKGYLLLLFFPTPGGVGESKGLDPRKSPVPFYSRALISTLLGARNETAIVTAVPISPRSRTKRIHFLQKQKTPSLSPPGNLKEIKNGINSSSGNPLFKNHMLSSVFHENGS